MMKDNKTYSDHSFEEFLSEDYFVRSNLYPTEESDYFWKKFEQENEGNLDDYVIAKRIIHDINKDALDEHFVAKMWDNIQTAIKPSRSIWYYRIGWVAAASIAVLLMFRIFLPQRDNAPHQPDIMAFANSSMTVSDATASQLILSNNQVVSLPEQESVVVYDSASIKVTELEIAKRETSAFHQLMVPKGKRLSLSLPDGTIIWVNSGTKLIYPAEFEQNKREIYVDGEIFLHVAHRNDQPFVVRTNEMDVQVLGTEFNVEAYGADMQCRVVLKSGTVRVRSANNKDTVLQPDEMYEKTGNNESVTQVDVNQYVSWMDGVYIYNNESLGVILTRLSRHYGREIKVNEAAAGLRCSGKLDLKEKPEDVFDIITFVAPVQYMYQDNTYLFTLKP